METDKKKHKSGFALLKEKLAKAEAENKVEYHNGGFQEFERKKKKGGK